MLVGFLLLGLVPVMVKSVARYGFSAPDTVAARFLLACVFVPLAARAFRQTLRTGQPGLLALRGILGGTAVLLYFTSVQLAGAGIGTVLNYSYPIWANLFSVALGERPARLFWLLLASALVGLYLVVDPRGSSMGFGELAGTLSAVIAGAAVLCIKRLRRTDGELVIILSFSVVGFFLALPFSRALWNPPANAGPGWALLLGVGVLSFLGHIYFTRGYKHTSIQLGTILSLVTPVVATLTGFWLLHEALTPSFLLGTLLILGPCGALAFLERR